MQYLQVFPQRQWFRERAFLLRYTSIASRVFHRISFSLGLILEQNIKQNVCRSQAIYKSYIASVITHRGGMDETHCFAKFSVSHSVQCRSLQKFCIHLYVRLAALHALGIFSPQKLWLYILRILFRRREYCPTKLCVHFEMCFDVENLRPG
jgi:hypothetical protein